LQARANGHTKHVNTIVVGYDASEAAERALARAAELAEAFGARLVVASVSRASGEPVLAPAPGVLVPPAGARPVPTGGTVPLPEAPPARRPEPEELAQHQLERARMSLAGRQLVAEYVAEIGDPADRLLELAERRDADLVVVGSREHGFLDRLLGRGVDEAVAGRAARDVLLVR
jgi:nucleotide-binding universal stress UspA family protein